MESPLSSLNKVEILIIASPGGHSVVAHELFDDCKWSYDFITSSNTLTLLNPMERRNNQLAIIESNRDFVFFYQLILAFKILIKSNPKIIVSSGAGLAIPFFIWGFFFRTKLIFIESASRVTSLSLTGKLLIILANRFYVRSPKLKDKYPNVLYFS